MRPGVRQRAFQAVRHSLPNLDDQAAVPTLAAILYLNESAEAGIYAVGQAIGRSRIRSYLIAARIIDAVGHIRPESADVQIARGVKSNATAPEVRHRKPQVLRQLTFDRDVRLLCVR